MMQTVQLRKSWVVAGCVALVVLYLIMGGSPTSVIKELVYKDSDGVGFKDVTSKLRLSARNCTALVNDWSKYNMSEEYFRLLPSYKLRWDFSMD